MAIDIPNPIGDMISCMVADNLGLMPINSKDFVESVARSLQFLLLIDNNSNVDYTRHTLQ